MNAIRTHATPMPKCRAMPLHTPVSQRPCRGRINGMRAGSNGSGDDVILLLCRAQGVAGRGFTRCSGNNQGVPRALWQ